MLKALHHPAGAMLLVLTMADYTSAFGSGQNCTVKYGYLTDDDAESPLGVPAGNNACKNVARALSTIVLGIPSDRFHKNWQPGEGPLFGCDQDTWLTIPGSDKFCSNMATLLAQEIFGYSVYGDRFNCENNYLICNNTVTCWLDPSGCKVCDPSGCGDEGLNKLTSRVQTETDGRC